MRVDGDTLALDVIANVGPGGHFVGEEHTRRNLRGEHWLPKLMDRANRETWEKGGARTMDRRVREKVTDILEQYEPDPLEEKLLRELKTIVALADERYGQK
jgi:trimethylamine--corrinoid protein Co-methyltransferase